MTSTHRNGALGHDVFVQRPPDAERIRLIHGFGLVCLGVIRLEILLQLHLGEASVSEVASSLDLDVSAVSHALHDLRRSELVNFRVVSRARLYSLSSSVRVTESQDMVSIECADAYGNVVAIRMPPD